MKHVRIAPIVIGTALATLAGGLASAVSAVGRSPVLSVVATGLSNLRRCRVVRPRARDGELVLALLAVVSLVPGGAGASGGSPDRVGHVRLGPRSGLSLSQAPAGLRAAVRRTLGLRDTRAGSGFKRGELTALDPATTANFGWSVALYGSTAVVGAPFKNSDTGAAYVFVRSSGKWSQQAELTASDTASGDAFGWSVALDGSTAVVGATYKNSDTGAAYVFVDSSGKWSQQAELTASDAAAGDFFSNAVAVSGSTAVVGAELSNSETGAAYVFVRSGTAWSQQAEFQGRRRRHDRLLGDAVAVSGSTAVVGAEDTNSLTGAAYVFVRSGTAWSQQAELTASDGVAGDTFGGSTAVSGSTAVVSAPTKNGRTGAAYVFVRSRGKWSQQAELTAPDAVASRTTATLRRAE